MSPPTQYLGYLGDSIIDEFETLTKNWRNNENWVVSYNTVVY